MKIKDAELKAILAEVQADLDKSLDLDTQKLAKSADDAPPAKDESEESAPEGAGEESAPAEASAGPEGSAPPAEASAPMAPPAEGSAPPMDGAPADPAMDQAASPEALQAEYSQLDPESLKAHYLAAKAALFAVMGAGAGAGAGGPPPAGPEASAPPMAGGAPPMAAGAPPAPPMDPNMPPPAMKGEAVMSSGHKKASGGQISAGKVIKSEQDELAKAEKAELAELRETTKLMERAFELLNQPVRKAVTNMDFVAKSEESVEKRVLSKSEITAKLKSVTSDPTLAKSDRDLVNGYYTGSVSIEKIEHLLK